MKVSEVNVTLHSRSKRKPKNYRNSKGSKVCLFYYNFQEPACVEPCLVAEEILFI